MTDPKKARQFMVDTGATTGLNTAMLTRADGADNWLPATPSDALWLHQWIENAVESEGTAPPEERRMEDHFVLNRDGSPIAPKVQCPNGCADPLGYGDYIFSSRRTGGYSVEEGIHFDEPEEIGECDRLGGWWCPGCGWHEVFNAERPCPPMTWDTDGAVHPPRVIADPSQLLTNDQETCEVPFTRHDLERIVGALEATVEGGDIDECGDDAQLICNLKSWIQREES